MNDDEDQDITTPPEHREQEGHDETALQAFAADPAITPRTAARAAVWDEYAHYGLWQVAHPVAAPGVRCLDLLSGTRRYLDLPGGTVAGMRQWGVWLGAAVPVDGVWRGTGAGIWLSPVEADAVVEFAEQALATAFHAITRTRGQEPVPPEPMMFGLAPRTACAGRPKTRPEASIPGSQAR